MTDSKPILPTPVVVPSASDSAPPGKLPRKLGALTLGAMFVMWSAPLAVLAGYQQLVVAFGNGVGAPVASFLAGVLVLTFSVGSIAMSRHMAKPGPFYNYIAEGLGKTAGLTGAVMALVAYLTITAGTYPYIGLVIVNLMKQTVGNEVGGWQVWGLVAIVLVTVLTMLRVDLSMRVLGVIVALETLFVAIWQVFVFVKGGPEGYSPTSFSFSALTDGNLGIALLLSMAALIGLESSAVFREETRNPEKAVPRATYGAIAFMAIFYGLGIWAYIIAVGPSRAVEDARNAPVDSFFASIEEYMGGFVPTLVSVLLVTSIIAAVNATQSAAVRYMFTLGRDHVLPRRLGRVHVRLGAPHVAALSTAMICLVAYGFLTLSKDVVVAYGTLNGFGTICVLPLLLGTSASVVLFFRRRRGLENRWRTTISPILAFVVIALVLIFALANMDVVTGTETGGIVAIVAFFLIIAASLAAGLRVKRKRPDVYERIGAGVGVDLE